MNLLPKVSKFFSLAAILVSLITVEGMSADNNNAHQHNCSPAVLAIAKEELQADYNKNWLTYRQNAVAAAERTPAPNLAGGFLGATQNVGGWASAINNYKSVMHNPVIPAESTWPLRGWVKKYNEALILFVDQNISQQYQNKFNELIKLYSGV